MDAAKWWPYVDDDEVSVVGVKADEVALRSSEPNDRDRRISLDKDIKAVRR